MLCLSRSRYQRGETGSSRSRKLAKKDLGDYHAIDPDDLGESELLYRIVDDDDPMPPEDFGKTF